MASPFGFANEHNAVLQIMGTPLLALPHYITHTTEYERKKEVKRKKTKLPNPNETTRTWFVRFVMVAL